ncbi:hypothetical protein SAMN05892883_1212 [Jatrophihabitans sp. GAS493]|uniref:DUF475 domain-containing protein n=1 Tax=Jatrophihabitans sp. GAS493 TaxID=1907575 RepID=UPI000BB76C4F|nr:DUF475 domain-containing protein [Jatrophihabitans sp. GAS493]SOD71735.1 hypothetical protein SAMN05892883_1212 [Jatrophihabitans sp. GAS493]
MLLRTFRVSFGITLLGLLAAFLYGGTTALTVTAILAVLEVSVSFDNAVVNATVLERMNDFWQRIFLTVGVLIAVFGMRLLFPVLIVCVTAKLSPSEAYRLAIEGGSIDTPGTYAYLLHDAHPAIAAFGGIFLLMLFLDFIFEEREITWLTWIEKPLAKIGMLDQLSVVVAVVALLITANTLAPEGKDSTVLVSGCMGLIVYLLVNGLGSLFEAGEDEMIEAAVEESVADGSADTSAELTGSEQTASGAGDSVRSVVKVAGKAAFFLFLYLEVLDATFSFDGVIGAFAITSDPIIIAIGLGIGALYIRSLTVFLVRKGTLAEYVFLEHGAQWAIGALAVLLLFTIKYEVPEVVTGLIGVSFIGAALASSIRRNRRLAAEAAAASQSTAVATTTAAG